VNIILFCWKNFIYVNYCGTHITQDECGLINRWYEWIGKGKIAMRVLSVQIIIPQFYSVCPNNTMWFHIAQVSFPDTYLKSKADRKATNSEPKIFWWQSRVYSLLCTFSSPRNQPVIAVNTKVREFETGTARDRSVLCKVRKYNTEPNWLMRNGRRYCVKK